MARIKLSEYRAKQLIYKSFGLSYEGITINLEQVDQGDLDSFEVPSVVKVDQAVKKRNKLGLVRLNRSSGQALKDLQAFKGQGFSSALVEPYIRHDASDECYLSMQLTDKGVEVQFSKQGGVDIEEHKDGIQRAVYSHESKLLNGEKIDLPDKILQTLLKCFEDNQLTYLEINPLLIKEGKPVVLDAAVEADSAAEFFVNGAWEGQDERTYQKTHHPSELAVEALAAKSPASLMLKVLNPDGAIFLLLSGGGASVVIADEIANLSAAETIANYGEYSGNPSQEETYLYTKELLSILINSEALKKVLLIAGGIANFTDVAVTFKGVIHALKDDLDKLRQQNLTVLVRRGGPNQTAGLVLMRSFLEEVKLKHEVYGPEMSLANIAAKSVEAIKQP